MPYAAAIKPADHTNKDVIADIAPSFSSAIAKIRWRENEWILESSTFQPFESDEKLYAVANKLVSQIHNLLALYMGVYYEPLVVYALLILSDDDRITRRSLYTTLKVNIIARANRVFAPTASGSLGIDVLSRAATDPALAEAISLVGNDVPGWPLIYDIIEFLGGPEPIAKLGFATTSETRRVRQTANHHRHLGSRKKYPLPAAPPTLNEGIQFAKRILKQWIAIPIAVP